MVVIVSLIYSSNLFSLQLEQTASSGAKIKKLSKKKSTDAAFPSQKGSSINALNTVKSYLDSRNPKVVGYLQVDYAHYLPHPSPLGDGDELRRAYLGVVGEATPSWGYTIIVDFGKNSVIMRDAFLKYSGFRPVTIRIGNMKEPLSLEHLITDTNATFLERALPVNGFIVDRRIGINADSYGQLSHHNYYTASLGLFGVQPGHTPTGAASDGFSGDGRLTFAYQHNDDDLIHLGVSGTIRKSDSNNTISFSSKPESDVTSVTFVNTQNILNATSYKQYGLEAAGEYRSLSLQGEYLWTGVNRRTSFVASRPINNLGLIFKGWYVYGSWFITGEHRPYDTQKAIFTSIKPIHSYGAWEVALRFSGLNLSDDSTIGGQEHNITLGLNWYVNDYVRFDANYIKVYANNAGLCNQPSIYTVRAQITFL